MTNAASSPKKMRGRPFPKGKSGNPKGRPQGSRNKATIALEALISGEAERVVQTMIDAAKGGDVTAAKALLDRLIPPRKGRSIMVDLPRVESGADLVHALSATIDAMASGVVTPDEAATIAGVLEQKRKAIELEEIERRLAALESKQAD
jgi:Family of unknown function (DUF5681)